MSYSINQKITLSFTSGGVPPVVRAMQFDNNMRIVEVSMTANGVPFEVPAGYGVHVRLRKPDGKHVYNPALEVIGNRARILLTRQMLCFAGTANAILEVVGSADGKDVLGSAQWNIDIAPNPVPEEFVESTDEYKTVQELCAIASQYAAAAAASAADAVAAASQAAGSADAAGVSEQAAALAAEIAQAAAGSLQPEVNQIKGDLVEYVAIKTNELNTQLSPSKIINGYINKDGVLVDQNDLRIVIFETLTINSRISISATVYGNVGQVTKYAFYKDFELKQLVKKGGTNSSFSEQYVNDETVPCNSYLAVCCQVTSTVSVTVIGDYKKTLIEKIDEVEENKLSKNQGAENEGKILGIAKDGTIYAKDMPTYKIEKSEILLSSETKANKYLDTSGNVASLPNYTLYLYNVNEGESVSVKGRMIANQNTALRYAFYTSTDIAAENLIQKGSLNSGGWNDAYEEETPVPVGAKILVVSNQNNGQPQVVRKYTEETFGGYQSWLYGKKIGVLGDSMAKGNGTYDGNCWPERIANRNNMAVDNQAINGKYLTQGQWSDSVIGGQVDNLSADCDIVVVYAGTNDITAQISIGTYDSVDTTTLNGTMNVLIPKLKNKYPTARILFITPYLRYIRNDDGSYTEAWNNQRDWIMALNEKCNEYGIPCWNNAIQGQIQWNNDAQRRAFTGTDALEFGDDYHLNDNGLNFVADLYEQFMMNPFGNTQTQSVENISDEHIYALIDERLGAIENGTY